MHFLSISLSSELASQPAMKEMQMSGSSAHTFDQNRERIILFYLQSPGPGHFLNDDHLGFFSKPNLFLFRIVSLRSCVLAHVLHLSCNPSPQIPSFVGMLVWWSPMTIRVMRMLNRSCTPTSSHVMWTMFAGLVPEPDCLVCVCVCVYCESQADFVSTLIVYASGKGVFRSS